MSSILVVAGPGERRDAWCRRLELHGYTTVVASDLLAGQRHLDRPTLAGLVIDARSDEDLVVLGALSSVRVLPPTVVVAEAARASVPTRLPAVRHLTPAAGPGLVARSMDALVKRIAPVPANLPFRLCTMLSAQWTSYLQIPVPALDDGFDGGTHPDGYELGQP
ncbi:MAG: hypothetical protein R3B06_07290 [Kofleriaceae bacterium]